jgi:hypothetical protein
MGFAGDLVESGDQTQSGIESKYDELRTASFFETWFEVHTAALFARRGCSVRFIRP